MPDNHIVRTLEEKPLDSLNGGDIARIESHISICDECKSAYDAARVAASLIHARAAETVQVGPFFNARVMAAIRASRLSPEEAPLLRMWRAAGVLVSGIAVLLAILVGMTIFGKGPDSQIELTMAASQNLYSPEYVVLERGDPEDEELANDQVVSTIYDLEDGDGQ
jgi:predicted anti-sigma-YlaC factor YlaD